MKYTLLFLLISTFCAISLAKSIKHSGDSNESRKSDGGKKYSNDRKNSNESNDSSDSSDSDQTRWGWRKKTTTVKPGGTTTSPPMTNNFCSTFNVTDSATGAHIKTGCVASAGAIHNDSYTNCSGHGMALYQITSNDTANGLFTGLASLGFGQSGNTFWIDGVKGTDGQWHYGSNGTTPAYSGIPWNTNATTATGCASAQYFSGWSVAGVNCTLSMDYICEF